MNTKTLVLLFTCFFAITASASERFISTTGTVRVEIPADKVKVVVSVRVVDPTLDGSNARLDTLVSEFLEKAKSLGVRERDVVLNNRISAKEWEWTGSHRIDKGFNSSIYLTLTLNDVRKFPGLATYMGIRDGFVLRSTQYTSSKEGEERKKAITGALKAAHEKAELLAKAGNATLGQLISATETNLEVENYLTNRNTRANMASNAYTLVSPSEGIQSVEFSVRVTASFELK